MGLYDTLGCEYPLPDPRYQDLEFQTRDLEWSLLRYTITRDGRLLVHAPAVPRDRQIALDRDVELPLHGDVLIYAAKPETDHGLVEYRVRFRHGRVVGIHRFLGFGAERRRRLPRHEPSAPGLRPSPPVPDPMGRPISAEDLAAHAPPKLELVDGRIPGDKGLLLLILTSLGVRRAAALVGYDIWKKGIE